MKFIPIIDDSGNAYLVSADKIRQIVIENYARKFPDGSDRVRIEFTDGFTQHLNLATKSRSHGLFLALSDKLNRPCSQEGDLE